MKIETEKNGTIKRYELPNWLMVVGLVVLDGIVARGCDILMKKFDAPKEEKSDE